MVSKSLICGCVLLAAAASASAGTVGVTTELVDTAGGSLGVVEVGQEFEVFVFAEDTRSKPTGFRGGTLDVSWDAAIIRCDEDLGSDRFTEDVARLGIVDGSVWGGPVAGAMAGSGTIELLTFTQAPPGIRPLGAGSPVLLCRVRFAAVKTGQSKVEIRPSMFGFVGGGIAGASDYSVEGTSITVVEPAGAAKPAAVSAPVCSTAAVMMAVAWGFMLVYLQRARPSRQRPLR
jgi:hypothetical protein